MAGDGRRAAGGGLARTLGSRAARIGVVVLGLLPLAALVWDFAFDGLGAEPVESITHRTGQWALRMLLLSLAVTPLRRLFGWAFLVPHRRALGLLSFSYATLHFATYLILDLELRLGELAHDVWERPYITMGASALLLLLPLAITSTRGWMRRLGRRWGKLHRLVYPAAIAALLHFLWSVKADLQEPLVYAGIGALLLGFRLNWKMGRRSASYATIPRSPAETLAASPGRAPGSDAPATNPGDRNVSEGV
jgi:sulfoxide reductase heme-binding subunit YedZ